MVGEAAATETNCRDESLPRNHWRDSPVISCGRWGSFLDASSGYEWINFRVLWNLGKIYRLQAKLNSYCKSVTSRPRQYSVVHSALAAPADGPNLVHRFNFQRLERCHLSRWETHHWTAGAENIVGRPCVHTRGESWHKMTRFSPASPYRYLPPAKVLDRCHSVQKPRRL